MMTRYLGLCVSVCMLAVGAASCSGGGHGSQDDGVDAGPAFDGEPGDLLWAVNLGGRDYLDDNSWCMCNQGNALAPFDDGSFAAGGAFVGMAVFGEGSEAETWAQAAGGWADWDMFTARYRADASLEWLVHVGGQMVPPDSYLGYDVGDKVTRLAATADGDLMAYGEVEVGAVLGEGEPGETVAEERSFLARYRDDGTLAWVRFIPGDHPECEDDSLSMQAYLGTSPQGKSVVASNFSRTAVLGQGEPGETRLVAGDDDIVDKEKKRACFVASYEPEGDLSWALKLDRPYTNNSCGMNDMAVGEDGAVVATGNIEPGNGIDEEKLYINSSTGEEVTLEISEPYHYCATATPANRGTWLAGWDADGELRWTSVTLHCPGGAERALLGTLPDGTILALHHVGGGSVFDANGPDETVFGEWDLSLYENDLGLSVLARYSSEGRLLSLTDLEIEQTPTAMVARADGSLIVTTRREIHAFEADMTRKWTAEILSEHTTYINDVEILSDGSVVVIGNYFVPIVLGEGEPNETTLEGLGEESRYGAFMARFVP